MWLSHIVERRPSMQREAEEAACLANAKMSQMVEGATEHIEGAAASSKGKKRK